jgi:protein required for attachment to host cells
MREKTITWVAVIDSNNAHFYGKGPELCLGDLNHTLTARPIRDDPSVGRRELGRVHDRVGDKRHIIEPHTDDKTQKDKQFTKEVATYLESALQEQKYNRLVVIAPPKILGILRKLLNQSVKDVIVLELDKELTHLTPPQIQEHLEKIVHI